MDYPKEHDSADVFVRAVRERGLGIEEETLQEIQVFSTRLARRRAPAFFEVRVEEQEARRAANDAAQMFHAAFHFTSRYSGT